MKKKRIHRFTAVLLVPIVFWALGAPLAARAQDNLDTQTRDLSEGDMPIDEGLVDELAEELPVEALENAELPEQTSVDAPAEPAARADTPEDIAPAALPTGEAKSAVSSNRISLPNAEGSVEGMGESFAPVLSSGTATFSVPIALPAGRAGVQPSLGLSYGSTGGNSAVGFGWNLSTPFIVRQSDRGLPRYQDYEQWTPEEDQFFYNGGQELIPVNNEQQAIVDESGFAAYAGADQLPFGVDATWQQYRARVEGGFMRFFRAPDFQHWVVQGKDGTRFDFGLLPLGEGPTDLDDTVSLQRDPDDTSKVYKWFLTRMADVHGSTVYYRYRVDGGEHYIDDVYYLSPNSCALPISGYDNVDVDGQRACNAPLSDYGVRVHLDYTTRPDVFSRYVSGWRVETALRLSRVTVTASEEVDAAEVGNRKLVRRYHLSYLAEAESFHSLLASVQVEGRPDAQQGSDRDLRYEFSHVAEEDLGSAIVGRTLPPMTFDYTPTPEGPIVGFGGIDDEVQYVASSPNVSVDSARADLFDVNTDGLPDLIVTDPARYRTDDGGPAVGVFFNGFIGTEAAGDTAVFSDPIAVPMSAGLSGTLNLGNANIVPMDVDGDGRSDLLHMPRLDSYGYFTPTRLSDEATGGSTSVADQGWGFTYAEVDLEVGTDPRIDFVRDGTHYKVWDVNGDHLIDVVRTTGTVMQTWMNLGWVTGDEGQFGQASWDGEQWVTSHDPYETCLLHDGLPVDFADPELRTADMNGDGLVDLVKVRRGHVVYWPSRGVADDGAPVFGEGPAHCPRGAGAGRQIVMETAPAEVNVELEGVFLNDVNMDGAADVVQVRFDEVDVWFNRAGEGFTERAIIDAPFAPSYAPRIRFADIDGSATGDLIYATSSAWQYLDFMGGERPRLLRQVQNGLGATTTLTYGSSAEDYVTDLVEGEFTWSQVDGDCDARLFELTNETECVYRSGGSPVISTVVRSVSTTDNFGAMGRETNTMVTNFAYHDGYYEGIEQEFRGFGAADAEAVGDMDHPTATTRTYFHQGRRPQSIATDRLADNPYEALKGRQYLSEVFDAYGQALSTSHATIMVRRLNTGLDGRATWYAYVSQSDELRYGHNPYLPDSASTVTLPFIQEQTVPADGDMPEAPDSETFIEVPIRAVEYAHIQSTTPWVDNVGQVRRHYNAGRIHDTESVGAADYQEEIRQFVTPDLRNGSRWRWIQASNWLNGDGTGGNRLNWVSHGTAFSTGDVRLTNNLNQLFGLDYDYAGDGSAVGYTMLDAYPDNSGNRVNMTSSTQFDSWGNPLVSCGGADLKVDAESACLRFASVQYDTAYGHLPIKESIATRLGSTGTECDPESGTFCMLTTDATWDRGFGVLRSATDPNEQTSNVGYDGLGRLSAVTPPTAPGDTCPTKPVQVFNYDLVPSGLPVSVVYSSTIVGCGAGDAHDIETRSYVDGLGRARASATQTQQNIGGGVGGKRWEKSGVVTFSARGTPIRACNNEFIFADPPIEVDAVGTPTTPCVTTHYDAFGRATQVDERDGSFSRTFYGTLSTTFWDPLDIGSEAYGSSPTAFATRENALETPTISRVDGHGRPIDQVLHQNDGVAVDEFYRLLTTYRGDGAVLSVTRMQTATSAATDTTAVSGRSLTRSFFYDGAGRRIGATDPDSDSLTNSDPASSTWRYLFNEVGDLVAVRDSRGCGQNFYYDRAGRLLAEDYVECGEAQSSGETPDETLPSDAVAMGVVSGGTQGVDVRHFYDVHPSWTGMPSIPAGFAEGRMTGVSDRGQRTITNYDQRGRPNWSARQMALIPDPGAMAGTTLTNPLPAIDRSDNPPSMGTRAFDEDPTHAYVMSNTYDRADRPLAKTWPTDPDFVGTAPVVTGDIFYNWRSLPRATRMFIDGVQYNIAPAITYTVDRNLAALNVGSGGQVVAKQLFFYDARLRPWRTYTSRPVAVRSGTSPDLNAVSLIVRDDMKWDPVNNLIEIKDTSTQSEWPTGQKPRWQGIEHDALYRVNTVNFSYNSGSWGSSSTGTDWRVEQGLHTTADPMRRQPAGMLSTLASGRVGQLLYRYDWLANMVEWTDDGSNSFYERALGPEGQIQNGFDAGPSGGQLRPTALYLSSDIRSMSGGLDITQNRGGWVHLQYGESGNVEVMTVRGQCYDTGNACWDDTSLDESSRATHLVNNCDCLEEHHYAYRWDELNRIVEARRYEWGSTRSQWELQVRQRYRYDGANQRTVKETRDGMFASDATGGTDRAALYVYPGDFERRGMVSNLVNSTWDASVGLGTETQYMVAGARVVWKNATHGGMGFEPDVRATYAMTNLIQSTTGVVDLISGELLERTTFYPSGARETLRTNTASAGAWGTEPLGFTGKEGDDEVGLTYFGERYLLQHLGRWASPDPLHVHQAGGGEFGNSFHYVGGNLLQTRDPLGLQPPIDSASLGRSTEWPTEPATPDMTFTLPETRRGDDGRLYSMQKVTEADGDTYMLVWDADEELVVNVEADAAVSTDDIDYALDAATLGASALVRTGIREGAELVGEAAARRAGRALAGAGDEWVQSITTTPGASRLLARIREQAAHYQELTLERGYTLEDLGALSTTLQREVAVVRRGRQRLLILGDFDRVAVQQGDTIILHTHAGTGGRRLANSDGAEIIEGSGLVPSVEDRDTLEESGRGISFIVNQTGDVFSYGPTSDIFDVGIGGAVNRAVVEVAE